MTTAPASLVDRHHPSGLTAEHHRPLRQPGFRPMLLAIVGAGAAGLLLTLFSIGSVIGGLAYGHRTCARPPGQRLLMLCAVVTMASGLLALAPSVFVLGGLLIILGLFLSPTLVTGYLLADQLAPRSARTEAASWIPTSINAGASVGAALAGALVDRAGTAVAFTMAAGLAAIATMISANRPIRP